MTKTIQQTKQTYQMLRQLNVKNLFTYSPIHLFTLRKTGFTLAEVLITLAIIGVVAVLTLPPLIRDYKTKAYETAFNNTRAKLQEVVKLMMAQEGVETLRALSLYDVCLTNTSSNGDNPDLRKYMNATKFEKNINYITLGGEDLSSDSNESVVSTNSYQVADGSIISIAPKSKTNNPVVCAGGEPFWAISVDTNGEKGPNQFGRDAFEFRVDNSGKLYGYGEKNMPYNDHEIILATCESNYTISLKDYFIQEGMSAEEFDAEWGQLSEEEKAEVEANYEEELKGRKVLMELGFGCSARIIENGGKMDY